MAPLLGWGLPSRTRDATLFGGAAPWPAERYRAAQALAARATRPAGADTDLDPLAAGNGISDLTPDDAARAAILRRYRLYSRQPDEMITFMALQRMNPRAGDFDPRMYQYGGAYVYAVAGALVAADRLGLVQLRTDPGAYLDHPERFGRLYVVARVVSLVFGLVALAATGRLARLAGGRRAGWMAAVLVAGSPVFITAVIEAKPHLASAAVMMCAIVTALAWRAAPTWRRTLALGLLAGGAFGLVLTGLFAAALVPALLLATRMDARRRLRLAVAVGVAGVTYAATNPFLIWNAVFHPERLSSNLGNSTAMYVLGPIGTGIASVSWLLLIGVGAVTLLGGLAGAGLALRRDARAAAVAIAAPLVYVIVGVLILADKPAEFARFLLVPALALAAAAAALLARRTRGRPVACGLCLVLALVAAAPWNYFRAVWFDAYSAGESRAAAARLLERVMGPEDTLGVVQEPAPYSVPPIDFTRRGVRLLPARKPVEFDPATLPEWLVLTADGAGSLGDAWWRAYYEPVADFAADGHGAAPITWACKPTFVFARHAGTTAAPRHP